MRKNKDDNKGYTENPKHMHITTAKARDLTQMDDGEFSRALFDLDRKIIQYEAMLTIETQRGNAGNIIKLSRSLQNLHDVKDKMLNGDHSKIDSSQIAKDKVYNQASLAIFGMLVLGLAIIWLANHSI